MSKQTVYYFAGGQGLESCQGKDVCASEKIRNMINRALNFTLYLFLYHFVQEYYQPHCTESQWPYPPVLKR